MAKNFVQKNQENNKGMGLVEIIIGAAIILSGVLAANAAYTTYVQYALANERNVQADYLLEEGLESMNFLRDKGWTANIAPLSTTTAYYLVLNTTYWAPTTTVQYIDGQFLRSVTVGDVKRDASDKITSSAGTYDPNTKLVTVSVSVFQGHATTTKSISTYITNLYTN